jgi:hypothetical protein
MGVSAVGDRGIRPRTIPVLFFGGLLAVALLIYLFGPPVMPGMRGAAEDKCNELNGANFRSYRLEWIYPQSPNWDPPHWLCKDARNLDKPGKSFGWWVNPF